MATRIAMWSGPRNISTALMRSFGSRADTIVVDEPLYGHYLDQTGLKHPGRDQILEQLDTDWRGVARALTAPLPARASVSYQKHMAHHLLPSVGREWLEGFEHAFLIREPREMLPSLARGLGTTPRLEDTGLPQQVRLFQELVEDRGRVPVVVDSRDLLRDPRRILSALCGRLGLDFDPAMLAWEAGPRPTDGCWGPIWYANTIASTGFAPWRPSTADLPVALEPLLDSARPLYEILHAERTTV